MRTVGLLEDQSNRLFLRIFIALAPIIQNWATTGTKNTKNWFLLSYMTLTGDSLLIAADFCDGTGIYV